MQSATSPTTTLSPLQAAVLETVVYGDLFAFPLTREEVQRWLPRSATADEVAAALADGVGGLVVANRYYVMLAGRQELAGVRERRRRAARALRSRAQTYGSLIGRLPFVRMVALTGSLAVNNAEESEDLDYLIVTAPGRVWLTRAMVMAVVRMAALRGVTLCPNYLLAETVLALPQRDYYTARELLHMRPISGHAVYRRMLAENAWWREFLPNAGLPDAPGGDGARPSLLRRLTESFLRLPPFDALERLIMTRKAAELRAASPAAEAVYDETMCKGHADAWRERTQQRFRERMQAVLEASL